MTTKETTMFDFLMANVYWMLGLVVLALAVMMLISEIDRTKVKEGTGTAFLLLEKYWGSVMSLKDFHFEGEAIVYGGGSSKTSAAPWVLKIGGWVYYLKRLIRPIEYTEKNAADGFGSGHSVFLNEVQKDIILEKAESKGNVPLDFKAVFTMRIVNIYQFLFFAPADVIVKVIKNMDGILRGWAKIRTYEEVQEVASDGGKMCAYFGEDIKDILTTMERDWGVYILAESIVITDVGLTDEDQEAFGAKRRQAAQADGEAQKLVGRMLANAAAVHGLLDADAVRVELKKTTRGKAILNQMLQKANDFVLESELAKNGGFMRIDGDPLTALVAGFLRGKGQNPPAGGNQGAGESDKKKKGSRQYTESDVKKMRAKGMSPDQIAAKLMADPDDDDDDEDEK